MKNLQIFNFQGNDVRIQSSDGTEWFVATDVAKSIGHSDPRKMCKMVKDRYRNIVPVPHPQNPVKQLDVTVISEFGIYEILTKSRVPKAEEFQEWLYEEVLPAIRKTGQYSITKTDEEIIVLGYEKALQKIKLLESEAEENRPKLEFSEAVRYSKNGILVREFVKILSDTTGVVVGEKRFFRWLRKNQILMPDSTEPYQRFIDSGYLERKETTYTTGSGETKVSFTTLITGKGQQYLTKRFLRENRNVCNSRTA